MPHRKKKSKPINRSVSDASQKKLKRGSIFNLFSKRSDPTLNTSAAIAPSSDKSASGTVAVTIDKRTGKPIGRSKSDVGYQRNPNESSLNGQQQQPRGRSLTLDRKRNKNGDNDESMSKPKKKSQLSPISENPPGERLFGDRMPLRATKSEEKPTPKAMLSTHHSAIDNTNNKSHNDLELMSDDNMQATIKRRPLSNSVSPPPPPRVHSQSLDSLHSSQLPQERLPLTKGLMVDGIVKRLSMDRFSPPPTLTSPAFSYTRPPTESIVYAQVLRDENGEKTSHNKPVAKSGHGDTVDFAKSDYRRDNSPSHHIIHHYIHRQHDADIGKLENGINNKYQYSPGRDSPDHVHRIVKKDRPRDLSPELVHRIVKKDKPRDLSPEHIHRIVKKDRPRDVSPLAMTPPTRNYSDEDEGIGFESRRRFYDDDMIPSRDITRQSSTEPPIIPTFRPSYGGSIERINELANRRKLLETKIQERTFGSPRELNGDDKRQYSPQRIAFIAEPSPPLERYPRQNGDQFATEQVTPIKTTTPPRKQWARQPRYYPETNIDDEFCGDLDSIRREQDRLRHKQRLEKEFKIHQQNNARVIDLGYIDQYRRSPVPNEINHPINYKHPTTIKTTVERRTPSERRHHSVDDVDAAVNNNRYPNPNFSTIEREKQKYRSFDKGDSGIENDIKRERDHNQNDIRQRSPFAASAIKTMTEMFLKRERQHTELTHPSKKRSDYVFRERSIDDGSHFDPRLDKFPKQEQQRGRHTLTRPTPEPNKKSEKKFGSLKRV